MPNVHDRDATITSQLGVADERSYELEATLLAEIIVDCKRQDREGEVDLNDGHEICHATERALKSAKTIQEGFVIGMVFNHLSDEIAENGVKDMLKSFNNITDEDTVETAYAKLLADIKANNE